MRCLCGEKINSAKVKEQWKTGERIGEFSLGDELLVHRYFFSTKYIRYDEIERLYIRVESGESGDFAIEECSLVLVDISGRETALHADRHEYAEEVMECMKVRNPNVKTGKQKK